MKKLSTLVIDIPYKRAGNIISQQPVTFDLYQEENVYVLVPLLDEAELMVANLPRELRFVIQDGKPSSLRGLKDGNLHVIQDAAALAKQQGIYLFMPNK